MGGNGPSSNVSNKDITNDLKGTASLREQLMNSLEVEKWRETIKTARRAALDFGRVLTEALEQARPLFIEVEKIASLFKLEADYEAFCKQHTWVPHSIMQGYLDYPNDDKQFDKVRVHWPEIRRKLLEDYADFGGGSRKKVFNQILKTFSAGASIIVVRSAIIEIEGLSADFCTLHASNTQSKRQNFITQAPDHMASLIPSDIEGLLPYIVMQDYSDQIFKSTEAHLYTDTSKANPNVNRHANAHGTHTDASEFDALNAILLLHHYAKYFYALDMQFKQSPNVRNEDNPPV